MNIKIIICLFWSKIYRPIEFDNAWLKNLSGLHEHYSNGMVKFAWDHIIRTMFDTKDISVHEFRL